MKIFSLLLVLLLVVGCAVAPKPLPVKKGMIADYRVDKTLAVRNVVQDDATKMEWTASLVELLASELKFKGAQIDPEGNHALELAITGISQNIFYALMANKCTITFDLHAGNSFSKEYMTYDVSGMSVQRACEFALTKGVAAILNDREVIDYLGADYP